MSTHSLIFFCRSRAFTVFIKYPLSWLLVAFFERLGHRQPTQSVKRHKRPGTHRHAAPRSAPPAAKAELDSPEASDSWFWCRVHEQVVAQSHLGSDFYNKFECS